MESPDQVPARSLARKALRRGRSPISSLNAFSAGTSHCERQRRGGKDEGMEEGQEGGEREGAGEGEGEGEGDGGEEGGRKTVSTFSLRSCIKEWEARSLSGSPCLHPPLPLSHLKIFAKADLSPSLLAFLIIPSLPFLRKRKREREREREVEGGRGRGERGREGEGGRGGASREEG
eukprot:2293324-Rhodomonas_salina.3